MTGLNPQEVKELIEYIQENNSWDKLYATVHSGRKAVKYYNMCFDTRTGDMWQITFYQTMGCGDKEVIFRTDRGYNLKEKIYEWLDEPRNTKEQTKIVGIKQKISELINGGDTQWKNF